MAARSTSGGSDRLPPAIRDAGPAAMADPVPAWDGVDEQSDESFPASDPPAQSPARADPGTAGKVRK